MKTVPSSAVAKPRAPSCNMYYMGLRIVNPPPWIDDVIGGVRDGKFKMHKYMLQASYVNAIRTRVITKISSAAISSDYSLFSTLFIKTYVVYDNNSQVLISKLQA